MDDDSDDRLDALHGFMAGQGHPEDRTALLTGWVVVQEWMDDSGVRTLTKAYSASLTSWSAGGMHHEALYGDWGDDDP